MLLFGTMSSQTKKCMAVEKGEHRAWVTVQQMCCVVFLVFVWPPFLQWWISNRVEPDNSPIASQFPSQLSHSCLLSVIFLFVCLYILIYFYTSPFLQGLLFNLPLTSFSSIPLSTSWCQFPSGVSSSSSFQSAPFIVEIQWVWALSVWEQQPAKRAFFRSQNKTGVQLNVHSPTAQLTSLYEWCVLYRNIHNHIHLHTHIHTQHYWHILSTAIVITSDCLSLCAIFTLLTPQLPSTVGQRNPPTCVQHITKSHICALTQAQQTQAHS